MSRSSHAFNMIPGRIVCQKKSLVLGATCCRYHSGRNGLIDLSSTRLHHTFNDCDGGALLKRAVTTKRLIPTHINLKIRSQWPRGLRRGSAPARLLGLQVRIPPEPRKLVSCEFCVLSSRGLFVGLIFRLEESCRVRCV